MKRFLAFLMILLVLFSFSGCEKDLAKEEMEQTLSEFIGALKVYDREKMSALLTEFPDNSNYVYHDDIFNDEGYVKLYQSLYSNIVYSVKSFDDHTLTVEATMPNVQSLYTNVMGIVLQMTLEDPDLQAKLAENEENGSILVREMMLAYVQEGYEVQSFTKEFTLQFSEEGEKNLIVCDDALRTLMTGNFFLSKNSTQP